ncbi:MAG: tRNA epoxyqueuosine(34) reductase QueG [Anaerolineae bacterium]|nr:tRNA epoxyqueuosine(34) reductase QueG [Anaerolineae bacterium]MDW8067829.1 tRNA epoxyqueuosine(34) reductase QueG [Anaerolineae bacterium]
MIEELRAQARSLGFDLLGVAPPVPPLEAVRAYRAWLAAGYHGEMAYMARPDRVAGREDPALLLPRVRAIVCVAVNYYPGDAPPSPENAGPVGRISRYAWGADYHDWMRPRLEALAGFIRERTGGTARHRAYTDTGPLLERALAAQAGLGFIGKNTCLIHPRFGSWLFLGEILVDVDLPFTGPPAPSRCGTCTRCLDACPTGALVAPYVLDARRCISYLTVEYRGDIPSDLQPRLRNWVYGCDVCQEVCPWGRFAHPTAVADFLPTSPDRTAPPLADLLALDEAAFQRRFGGSPIARIGVERLKRNARAVLTDR